MSNKKQNLQKKKSTLKQVASLSGIAIQMIAIIAIGLFAGIKLDEKFPNKKNLYTLGLTLASVILSIIYVIKRVVSASKEDK